MIFRTYSELITIPNYKDRFEYLRLDGEIGIETFGFDRYLNQVLYRSKEWRQLREKIILRDSDYDLVYDMAHKDFPINGRVIIHHINPITLEDIENRRDIIFDMDNLVCVSHVTHEAIHYGDANLLPKEIIDRKPNDTKLW